MQRLKTIFPINRDETIILKQKLLNWSKQFSIFCFLDTNSYPSIYNGYECLLATEATEFINITSHPDCLSSLQKLHDSKKDWLFGNINYDFKNYLEKKLFSDNEIRTYFPDFAFFIPATVCYINKEQTEFVIESFSPPEKIHETIINFSIDEFIEEIPEINFLCSLDKKEYIETINTLKEHIANGDCYEINYCTSRHCNDVIINPLQTFNTLNNLSPSPFAAYYRLQDKYLLCASPERYLKKENFKLISQPIKGTARRDADAIKDFEIKNLLRNDIKECAENIMIVDLVRNDIAKCCETGSIKVDELFGVYTYPQVHQLISTVSGTIKPSIPFTDAIRHSFPMGSMTGAPKHIVMQMIEKYEDTRRELFAGTIGYITPDGDFDFNVIIRSLFYNETLKHLSYHTGGAITYDSVPEQEWDEMRLKAWALERIFSREFKAITSV